MDRVLPPPENCLVEKKKSRVALIGIGLTGGVAVGLSLIAFPFVSPALRRVCLPYVPATGQQLTNVMKLCNKKACSTLVDLGSGDGRIIIEAARRGYLATGYELNPWLVLYSKFKARMLGLHRKAAFERKDLWKTDLSKFDNIVIFGVAEMMDELSVKMEREIADSARVIACRFPVKDWKPVDVIEEGIDSVWMYTRQSFLKD